MIDLSLKALIVKFLVSAKIITSANELEIEMEIEWKPIETAPDGKFESFLVKNSAGQVAPMIRGIIHNNVGTPWDWYFGEKATHWMPFPKP